MNVYMELGRIHKEKNISSTESQIRVCVGKEWHRFPNSFFLPDSKRWELHFIESEFRGQLPKHYSKVPDATRIIPLDMNDRNLEEPTRYLNKSLCHFLVDSDYPTSSIRNPRYSIDTQTWQIVSSVPFLDANATPQPWRSFYIPFISESKCKYISYNLLRNKQLAFRS